MFPFTKFTVVMDRHLNIFVTESDYAKEEIKNVQFIF